MREIFDFIIDVLGYAALGSICGLLIVSFIDWCITTFKTRRPPCNHEYVVEYNEHFEPYLKCEYCNKIKQIKDVKQDKSEFILALFLM